MAGLPAIRDVRSLRGRTRGGRGEDRAAMGAMVRNPGKSIPNRPAHDRLIGRGARGRARQERWVLEPITFHEAYEDWIGTERRDPEGAARNPVPPEAGGDSPPGLQGGVSPPRMEGEVAPPRTIEQLIEGAEEELQRLRRRREYLEGEQGTSSEQLD